MKRALLLLALVVLTIMPIVAGTALAERPERVLAKAAGTPAANNSTTTPAIDNSQGTVNSGGVGGGVGQYCTQYDCS